MTAGAAGSAAPARCWVTVCRGCCCGDGSRYPDVDHERLVADLRDRVRPFARLRAVGCLLSCGDANVVVVSPAPLQRRGGARPVWLGRMFTVEDNEAVARWLEAGGPGHPLSPELRERATEPFLSARRGRGRAAGR